MICSTAFSPTHSRQVAMSLQSKIGLVHVPFSRLGHDAGQPRLLGESSPVVSAPQSLSAPPHVLSIAAPSLDAALVRAAPVFESALQADRVPAGGSPAALRAATHF